MIDAVSYGKCRLCGGYAVLYELYKRGVLMKTAYCFNCQQVRMVKNPKQIRINNRPAVEGTCPVCGEEIFRIASTHSNSDRSGVRDHEVIREGAKW